MSSAADVSREPLSQNKGVSLPWAMFAVAVGAIRKNVKGIVVISYSCICSLAGGWAGYLCTSIEGKPLLTAALGVPVGLAWGLASVGFISMILNLCKGWVSRARIYQNKDEK